MDVHNSDTPIAGSVSGSASSGEPSDALLLLLLAASADRDGRFVRSASCTLDSYRVSHACGWTGGDGAGLSI